MLTADLLSHSCAHVQMRETTELLERNSGMHQAVPPPADNERVIDRERGFFIP